MLSNKVKELLRASQATQGKIADATARTIWSVTRWIDEDNKMLETPTVIQIIKTEFELTDEEVLEPAQKAS